MDAEMHSLEGNGTIIRYSLPRVEWNWLYVGLWMITSGKHHCVNQSSWRAIARTIIAPECDPGGSSHRMRQQFSKSLKSWYWQAVCITSQQSSRACIIEVFGSQTPTSLPGLMAPERARKTNGRPTADVSRLHLGTPTFPGQFYSKCLWLETLASQIHPWLRSNNKGRSSSESHWYNIILPHLATPQRRWCTSSVIVR